MTLATPIGTDFTLRPGLTGALLSDRALLLESLARRLRTRKGALWYDPTYGSYLPDALGESFADGGAALAALCEVDLEDDPRVLNARVTVAAYDLERVSLNAALETADGPFDFVVEALNAHLLFPQVEEVLPNGVG